MMETVLMHIGHVSHVAILSGNYTTLTAGPFSKEKVEEGIFEGKIVKYG
jgi:hypothetical protein